MKRILYLITSTGVGGTERTLLEICRRLDRGRYEPTVVSLKSEGRVASQIRGLGVEVVSLKMREAADLLSAVEFAYGLLRLPRLLRGRTFDLIHSFLFRANLFGRFAAGRCGAQRTVASFRGTLEEPRPWMMAVERRTIGRSDAVCTLSETLSSELTEQLGVPAGKIVVIPNGVDVPAAEEALAACGPEPRQRLGLSPADMVIGTVGRLHREKGLACLLEAFRLFTHEHPRAKLLLAGEGPERERLERQAEKLRISSHLRFLGAVSSPWEVLAATDIFVLSSLYEGMPNALLEAMAAALPVVATRVGAVPEMVEEGREGLLVPAADPKALFAALDRLAWSADLRREMGRRGRQRAEEKFSPAIMAARLDELYRVLLS